MTGLSAYAQPPETKRTGELLILKGSRKQQDLQEARGCLGFYLPTFRISHGGKRPGASVGVKSSFTMGYAKRR